MFSFPLLISRLVPATLLLSLFLVLGRFWHDRLAPRSRVLARWSFGAILGLGGLVLVPYLVRTGDLLGAELAFQGGRWPEANRRFVRYFKMGGRPSEVLNGDWASSLINMRRWREAETVLISGVRRTPHGVDAYPRTILLLGMCRYYEGRHADSEKTLRAVCGPDESVCHYFLGRIAERKGDLTAAIESYGRSLRRAPQFFPAVYQAVRLLLEEGGRPGARVVLKQFVDAGAAAEDPETSALRRAIEADGGGLPEREFYLVQN